MGEKAGRKRGSSVKDEAKQASTIGVTWKVKKSLGKCQRKRGERGIETAGGWTLMKWVLQGAVYHRRGFSDRVSMCTENVGKEGKWGEREILNKTHGISKVREKVPQKSAVATCRGSQNEIHIGVPRPGEC